MKFPAIKIDDDTELKLIEPRHAEEFFELVYRNRKHIAEWMFWVSDDYTLADTQKHIKNWIEKLGAGDGFEMGIRFKGALAGCIHFNYINRLHRNTEIGYWLGAEFQGHGLITKSCRAMTDYAFSELQLHRVELRCMSENLKSRRIPVKLGFTEEARIREVRWRGDHFDDHIVYSMLSNEWQKLNSRSG